MIDPGSVQIIENTDPKDYQLFDVELQTYEKKEAITRELSRLGRRFGSREIISLGSSTTALSVASIHTFSEKSLAGDVTNALRILVKACQSSH
jgi:hypothetical protein